MSNEIIGFAKEDPGRIMKHMIIDENEPSGSSTKHSPPIEFVTQNGFSILRFSELQASTVDSASECHFLVRQPDGEESEISVAFQSSVVAQLQSQRNSPLPDTSDFWLTLAEEHLATYLWKNNHFPAGGHLVINQLSGHDLGLAARWRE